MATLQPVTFGEGALPGLECGDKSLPAVVVIQEWWGITPEHKFIAELIASKGFRVLVPDLYKGKLGVTAEEAHHLMNNLDFQAAVKEIGQAVGYLLATGSPKVGITGFCMGGALSFAAGQHVPQLAAVAPCYGIPDSRYFQIEDVKAPILGVFGGKDKHAGFSDVASAEAAAAKIRAAGGSIELHVAPGGVHGFFNQLAPGGLELTASRQGEATPQAEVQQAFDALIAFFKKQLAA